MRGVAGNRPCVTVSTSGRGNARLTPNPPPEDTLSNSPVNTSTGNRVQQNLNERAGALVWWDFEDVKVRASDALAVIRKHGMDGELTVPVLTDEQGIRKAAAEFTAGRASSDKWKAEVAGVYDDGSIEVALLKHVRLSKDKAAAKKVEWTHEDGVMFDRNSRSWLYAGKTEAAAKFIALADIKREYLGADFVRKMLVFRPLVGCGAFPLRRRQGGFFFVPNGVVDKAEKLSAIIADLPCDAYLNVAHISGTEASRNAIGNAARDYLKGGLGDLKQRLAAWREAHRTPRADALENALGEFTDLRNFAILYRDALGLEIEDLTREMDEAMQVAQDIAGVAEKGVPPAFVAAVKALVGNHGAGVEIPYTALDGLGLPENACNEKAQAWWSKGRGVAVAEQAGYTVASSVTGLTFKATGQVIPLPAAQEAAPEAPFQAASVWTPAGRPSPDLHRSFTPPTHAYNAALGYAATARAEIACIDGAEMVPVVKVKRRRKATKKA